MKIPSDEPALGGRPPSPNALAAPRDDTPAAAAVDDSQGPGADEFDRFFRAQYPNTVRLAHLLTGSNAVAEELAQDAFERIFPRFHTLEQPAAYLRVSTVNVCRNWARHRSREQDRFRRHGHDAVYALDRSSGGSVDATVDGTEEMLEVIATLPYRQRAVLVMRYWLDLSEADIAAALDCRPGTVKSLHSRALTAIRKELP